MKIQLINFSVLVTLSSVLLSCSSSSEKTSNTTDTTQVAQEVKIEEKTKEAVSTVEEFSEPLAFEGTMNGKIPVFIKFSTKGRLISGELTYIKSGIPIPIKGEKNEEWFYVTEFDKKGKITGIMDFKISNDSLVGKWFNPGTEKSYELKLTKVVSPNENKFDLAPVNIEGTYDFDYGKELSGGHVEVKKIGSDKIVINLDKHNGAPGFHLASMDGDTLTLTGNKATFKKIETEYYNCHFHIEFFKDFIYITYEADTKGECGFGANAFIDGVYYKTK